MFELFRKKKELNLLIVEPTNEAKTALLSHKYPVEVLEIHNEFNTAADRLLLSANAIIAEASTKDAVKVTRLESLGFKQAAQVIELKPILEQAVLSKEQIELLRYYQQNYPFNKFITESQVEIICKKYNLVCGDVNRFKGFVPEKNLRDVEKFKLKETDTLFRVGSKNTYRNDSFNEYGKIDWDGGEQARRWSSRRSLVKEPLGLQICAPIKDMDMTDMTIENGYRMKEVVKHIPDPVVLQPVKGGYLILTMWADETFDPFKEPILLNEINN